MSQPIWAERTARRDQMIVHFPVGNYDVVVTFEDRSVDGNNPMTYSRITVYHGTKDVTDQFVLSHDFGRGETPGELLANVMAKLDAITK